MSLRRAELNTLKLQKGTIQGNRFPLFDSIKDCDSSCRLVDECPYEIEEKKNGTPIKCKLQGGFLRTMMDIVLSNLPEEKPSEYTLQKVGLMLMPLYKQLVSLQMLESSLTDIVVGEEGATKIHPVYKEIRIVSKDIDKCLRTLGVNSNVVMIAGENADPRKQLYNGDPDYYSDMQDEHEEESKLHKKKK